MSLTVDGQQATDTIEIGVVAYSGEQVENFPVVGGCVSHAVRREHRQLQQTSNADGSLVPPRNLRSNMRADTVPFRAGMKSSEP